MSITSCGRWAGSPAGSCEAPRALFDANIFYPHGLSLAFSEPMLVPASPPSRPVYAVSRNPILAYNVTVVLFQALAGWAGYYAARQLTGSAAAGWIGGIAFALSPIRTGYYHFAHMQLSFAMPLALLAFARFLERRAPRDLAWALFFVWCQMVTVIYFGIPLILLLALLMAGVLLLRPRGWRPAHAPRPPGRRRGARPRVPARRLTLPDRASGDGVRAEPRRGRRAGGRSPHLPGCRPREPVPPDRPTRAPTPAMFPGFTVYALVAAAFAARPAARGAAAPAARRVDQTNRSDGASS